MADGSAARDPWVNFYREGMKRGLDSATAAQFADTEVRKPPSGGGAGLNEPPKRRINLSFGEEIPSAAEGSAAGGAAERPATGGATMGPVTDRQPAGLNERAATSRSWLPGAPPGTLPFGLTGYTRADAQGLLDDPQKSLLLNDFRERRFLKPKELTKRKKQSAANKYFDRGLVSRLVNPEGAGEALRGREAVIEANKAQETVGARQEAERRRYAKVVAPDLKVQAEFTRRVAAANDLDEFSVTQAEKDAEAAAAKRVKTEKETHDANMLKINEGGAARDVIFHTKNKLAIADGQGIERFGRRSLIGALLGVTGAAVYDQMYNNISEDPEALKALEESKKQAAAERSAALGVTSGSPLDYDPSVMPPTTMDTGAGLGYDPSVMPPTNMDTGAGLDYDPSVMPPTNMTRGDPIGFENYNLPPPSFPDGVNPADAPIPPPMEFSPDDAPIPRPTDIPPEGGFTPADAPIPAPLRGNPDYEPQDYLRVIADPSAQPSAVPEMIDPHKTPEMKAIYDQLLTGGPEDIAEYDRLWLSNEAQKRIMLQSAAADTALGDVIGANMPGSPMDRYVDGASAAAQATDQGLPAPDFVPENAGTRLWDNAVGAYDSTIQPLYDYGEEKYLNAWDRMVADDNFVGNGIRSMPDWARSVGSGTVSVLNPMNQLDFVLSPVEERAQQVYDIPRAIQSVLDTTGASFYTDPALKEVANWAGMEVPDTGARATEGLDPMLPPADTSSGAMPGDVSQGMGSGTGASSAAGPTFAELQKLEGIGALGQNPDGTNKTATQWVYENPGQVASSYENPLPSMGDIPEASLLGDSRRDPRPKRPFPAGRPEFPGGGMPAAPPPFFTGGRDEFPGGGMPAAPPIRFEGGRPEVPGAGMPEGAIGQRSLADIPMDYPLTYNDLQELEASGGLGLRPNGEPITLPEALSKGLLQGRNVDMGQNQQDASLAPADGFSFGDLGSIFGSPAQAGTVSENPDIAASVKSIVDADETMNPKGSGFNIGTSIGNFADGLFGIGSDVGQTPQAPPAEPAPADPRTPEVPASMGLNEAGTTTTEPNGPQGDFNRSKGSTSAGLADNAEAAEEELNWINRMMRDKMGMTDASSRNKAAQALITGGAAMLASKGDGWQALGEGLQAGYGTVSDINASEADAQAAAYEEAQAMMLEDGKFRQQWALEQLRQSGAGAKEKEIEAMVNFLMEANPGMAREAAITKALEMAGKPDLMNVYAPQGAN